ncbi:TPA: hypothetical protein ACPIDV_000461 [Pseudomonas aeruginosa]
MEPKSITKDDEESIREWLNCEVAEVDSSGDVWVATPMVGHWLSDERKAEFIEWRNSRLE